MWITESVYMFDSSKYSHVYLIKAGENILIDTGLPGAAATILDEINGMGMSSDSIKTILLTHHDVDHIGNAKKLQDATHATIWADERDIPYMTGRINRPGIKRLIEAVVRPGRFNVSAFGKPGQEFGGIKAIHAPGHTPGHTIFKFGDGLFTGDLVKTGDGRLKQMTGVMNYSDEEIRKSIAMLKDIEFEWLLPSHGDPIRRGPAVMEFLSRY
jgi:glyoxylase-like metal-dependent hydrolase (beta-lactamase superfamily II)